MREEILEDLKNYATSSINEDGEVMYSIPMYFVRRPLGWPGDEKKLKGENEN